MRFVFWLQEVFQECFWYSRLSEVFAHQYQGYQRLHECSRPHRGWFRTDARLAAKTPNPLCSALSNSSLLFALGSLWTYELCLCQVLSLLSLLREALFYSNQLSRSMLKVCYAFTVYQEFPFLSNAQLHLKSPFLVFQFVYLII